MSSQILAKDLDVRRFSAERACHFAEVLFENAAGAQSGENIECLHDMRVASRRLRETFELFGMFYRPSKLKKILNQVKNLTRILGLPREMDVNLALLQEFEGESDPVVLTAHEHLLEAFERRQGKARRKMHRTFEALDLKALRAEWLGFAQTALLAPKPQSILSGIQREFESEAYLRQTTAILRQKASPIQAFRSAPLQSETDENLHRLRIALKKFRYALEIYDPLHDHRLERAIRLAKELQDVLGKVHDHVALTEQLQAHKIDLLGNSHLKLAAGCESVIEFFQRKKRTLYPLLEPSYTALILELNVLLTPKTPLQFSSPKRRRDRNPRRTAAAVPLTDNADRNTG
jgi:CHAD domain-containing protein